jgi:hypothetical protein
MSSTNNSTFAIVSLRLAERYVKSLGMVALMASGFLGDSFRLTIAPDLPLTRNRVYAGIPYWLRSKRDAEMALAGMISVERSACRLKTYVVVKQPLDQADRIVRACFAWCSVSFATHQDLVADIDRVATRIALTLGRMKAAGELAPFNREYAELRQGSRGTSGTSPGTSGTKPVTYAEWLAERLQPALESMLQSGAYTKL